MAVENNGIPYYCQECKNTGIVKEKDGQVHTCWKCMAEGRLDCHSKNLPDTNIRL
jgi:ribosomal protein L37AE/L43A